MPKNIKPQQHSKAADNSMTKNQFTFKITRPPVNLTNDPSVMKNQFHLKFDKITRTLDDAEPVHKPRKRHLPRPVPTETKAPNHITTYYHPYSSVSETPSGRYTTASSPAFFTTAQTTDQLSSTHNLDASVTMSIRSALIPNIRAEKIKIPNLINAEMIDENKLDEATINSLAKVFAEGMEINLTTAKRW